MPDVALNTTSLSMVPAVSDGAFFLAPVPGVLFSEYGMEVVPGLDLSFEDWQLAGESLASLQRRSYMIFMWGWGDWLNEGKRKYGEKYTQGMEITGLRYRTLANYSYVSAATPRYLRGIGGLTQRHYLAVAKIKDPIQKLRFLIDAAVYGWTASIELPAQIKAENLAGDSDSGSDTPPLPTLEDEIYQLQQEKYKLERSIYALATNKSILENIIARSVSELRDIMLEIKESELDRKVRVVIAILESEPRGEVFEAIVSVVEQYKAGDMTALVAYMDQIINLMLEE